MFDSQHQINTPLSQSPSLSKQHTLHLDSWRMAPLVVEYGTNPGCAMNDEVDAILTMLPPACVQQEGACVRERGCMCKSKQHVPFDIIPANTSATVDHDT